MNVTTDLEGKVSWQKIVSAYSIPDLRLSIWQLINTLIPFFALFYFTMRSVDVSLWLTLPLSILTAGFMVRTFIIFHDCGHGSFFRSQRANDIVGVFTGLLAFTPYQRWKHEHAIHHATSGDLDRRGVGDVYTMTVQEYLASPWWKRLGYRVMRNPFAMFLIGPTLVFVIGERIPPKQGKREIASVWWTNLALAIIIPVMGFAFGWKAYLITQLLVLFFGTGAGYGCSMFSIISRECIGSATASGITSKPACRAVPFINCLPSCSGSAGTSVSITSTIWARRSPITTLRRPIKRIPSFTSSR
jgi:omega-6 fatty acid desaturase (delta-12 desaturase)